MKTVLVTGSAGFIGYHLSAHLLDEGFAVVGFDGMTDYYDVELKRRRHAMATATLRKVIKLQKVTLQRNVNSIAWR